MSSLVEELQRDALDSTVSVSDLLRKAYAVASKLKLDVFQQWCDCELKGYRNAEIPVPDYRKTKGDLRAKNPVTGAWMIVHGVEASSGELTGHTQLAFTMRMEVGALQDLIDNDDGTGSFGVNIPPNTKVTTNFDSSYCLESYLFISRTAIVTVLNAARNTILDWSLKLEADGIIGDGMSFKPEEKRIAKDNADSLQSPIYIFMHNSSIQNASPGASQNHG